MEYLSHGTLGIGPRTEPGLYSGTPARRSNTGPRHLAADPEPVRGAPPQPRRLPATSAWAGRQWPLVADELFFIAHDDWHKPRLHRDVARLGLGAAVIAELLMTKYVDVHDDDLVALVAGRPADAVAARLMIRLLDEPQDRPVRDWLAYLADPIQPDGDIYEQVAHRMVLERKIRAERSGLLRRSNRYVPLDSNDAAWAWARLSDFRERGERPGPTDIVLGGLILATDLHSHVLTGAAGPVAAWLRRQITAAPAAVRELLRHTEAAVGTAVSTVA